MRTQLSLEIKRRLVLLTMAGLTPTIGSAQVPLDLENRQALRVPPFAVESILQHDAGVGGLESSVLPQIDVGGTLTATPSSSMTRELLKAGPGRSSDGTNRGDVLKVSPPWNVGPEQAGRSREGTATLQAGRPPGSAIGWSIAAGIAAGFAVSGFAASKYGENEGGRFCTRCFVQWSAISVPVGAGVGAAVGYLIDRARR